MRITSRLPKCLRTVHILMILKIGSVVVVVVVLRPSCWDGKLILLHSERPKLLTILVFLSAIGFFSRPPKRLFSTFASN